MADLKVKISEFPLATEAKDSDDIAILQDGENKRIKTPKIEEKILEKVEERYVNKNKLGVSNGVATLGSDGKLSPNQRFTVDINPSFIPIDLTTPPSEVDGVFLPTTSGVYENYGGLSIDLGLGSYLITKIGDVYKSILLAVESTLIANDIEDLRSKEPAYEGQIITLLGYYEAGDKEPLNYKWSTEQGVDDSGSVINTENGSWIAIFGDSINVMDFGAKGDGITDDTLSLQNAINKGSYKDIILPSGIFLVSQPLIVNDFKKIIGRSHLWNSNDRNTIIKYVGVADDNISVLHNSKFPIGVEPTNAISASKINNLVIDANNLAGYGVYSAYAINESSISDVTAINATKIGIFIDKCWYSTFNNLTARANKGCGIVIGYNASWGGVNGCKIDNIQARANGTDATFDTNTNPLWGFGLGLFQGADLVANNVVCEQNYGAGVVISNNTAICGIRQGYFEGNCLTFEQNWGIVYNGISNGRGHFIEDVYLHGVHTSGQKTQWISLIGEEPAGNLIIKNAHYGRVYSQIERYTLESVGALISQYIVGKLPLFNVPIRINGRNSFTTVYVRPDGNDNNIGSDVSNALLTLEKAIELSNKGNLITTIDCEGCNLMQPTVVVTRDITINGGGTGIVSNTTNGLGLTVDTNGFIVNVINFASISRVIHNGKGVLNVSGSTVSTTDSQNFGCIRSTSNPLGKTVLNNLVLTGINSLNATPTSIDVRGNVIANSITFQNLTTKHIRMELNVSDLTIQTFVDLSGNISWNNTVGIVKTLVNIHFFEKTISLWSVKQSLGVSNITTPDATDLTTALSLVNELKAKLNSKLDADRDSGQQAT